MSAKGDENVPRGKCLINKMSVGTPPPPKPWETTTNGGSTKDTPLASGDAIKPWDVPGAGERPSGALRSSLSMLCCVLLFALLCAHLFVRVNAFDFFSNFQLR